MERLEERLVFSSPNIFTVTTTADTGPGSLRQALVGANFQPNVDASTPDVIRFDIPTSDSGYQSATQSFLITVGSNDLPAINESVNIDGYTESGASRNTLSSGSDAKLKIEIRGPGATVESRNGLVISSGNATVQGLVIDGFDTAITTVGSGGNHIVGNFIGTDVTGTSARANRRGIDSDVNGDLIGGGAPADRNVISGNTGAGVTLDTDGSANTVQGNYIGTNAAGTADIANLIGIDASQSDENQIGGTQSSRGNLISGNTVGIRLENTANGNTIQGNRIGLTAANNPLGNSSNGIEITSGASNNQVGGSAAGAGNTIAYNGGAGVDVFDEELFFLKSTSSLKSIKSQINEVSSATGNRISRNSIFANEGLGIDLDDDGVTANDESDDSPDGDSGPNNLQNFPDLSASGDKIVGKLVSTPSTTFTIEYFENGSADPSGYGEGQTYKGSLQASTNIEGIATFTIPGPYSQTVPFITATATDPDGNTSEFSLAVHAPNLPPTADPGGPYSIIELQPLSLHATGSDPEGDNLGFFWDVNGDGNFNDATGTNPLLSWQQLNALGIVDGPSTFNVRVRADDGHGNVVTSDPTTLTINDLAPTLTINGAATATAGTSYSLSLSATDPNNDAIRGWFVNWGDGTATMSQAMTGHLPPSIQQQIDSNALTVTTVAGAPATLSHTYTTAGNRTLSAIAGDVDGGTSNTRTLQITVSPAAPAFFQLYHNVGSSTTAYSVPVLANSAASAASVHSYLQNQTGSGAFFAVAVLEPLTDPAAVKIFDDFKLQFVFTDFIDATRVGRTRSIADQVAASAKSSGAFVGNFNFYPNAASDPTRPGSLAGSQDPRFKFKPSSTDYSSSRGNIGRPSGGTIIGNQLADPALLPGSVDYRNPAQGNSGAPNIRSALFTLPIQRITLAELGIKGFSGVPGGSTAFSISGPNQAYTGSPGGRQELIPYVTRFDNYGNPALGGPPSGTGFVQNAATPANGQLLSRGDFQAMILHYRMRGADGVITAYGDDPNGPTGVVGYKVSQEASDIKTGWSASSVGNGIFNRGQYAFANLTNTIGDADSNSGDVNPRNTELSGCVWSGVYDRAGSTDPATGRRRMTILVSNLSAVQRVIDLPNNIGGFSTFKAPGTTSVDRFDDFVIQPGQHRLLNFALQTSSRNRLEWVFTGDQFIGLDNNRNGVGKSNYVAPAAAAGSLQVRSLGSTSTLSSGGATDIVKDQNQNVLKSPPSAGLKFL